MLFFLDKRNLQNFWAIIRLLSLIYFYINIFSKNRINTARVSAYLNLSKLLKLKDFLLFCTEDFLNILLFCSVSYLFVTIYSVFSDNITFILFFLVCFAYCSSYFVSVVYLLSLLLDLLLLSKIVKICLFFRFFARKYINNRLFNLFAFFSLATLKSRASITVENRTSITVEDRDRNCCNNFVFFL